MKNCPFCAEEIKDVAIICKHCGRQLVNNFNTDLKILSGLISPFRIFRLILFISFLIYLIYSVFFK
jgi:predicted amidophosphoribosyltransferase